MPAPVGALAPIVIWEPVMMQLVRDNGVNLLGVVVRHCLEIPLDADGRVKYPAAPVRVAPLYTVRAVSPLEMTNSFALHGSAMSSSDENIKLCARFIGVLRAVCARTPSVFFVERVLQDFSQCLLARNFFQS